MNLAAFHYDGFELNALLDDCLFLFLSMLVMH